MGLFNHRYSSEAKQLKSNQEQFPLSRSLRSAVLERYAPAHRADEVGLALDEIFDYLRKIDNFELPTLAAILEQTESIGDPGLPSREQIALVNWLDAAFSHWEKHFPTEEPLTSVLKKMRPVAIALAITDPTFTTPGAHRFHLIMDSIGLSLVGWQSRLGRAGQNMERMARDATAKSVALLDGDVNELQSMYEGVASTIAKDRGRAHRMSLRIVESELGHLKTIHAKDHAAKMINAALQRYKMPVDIGTFLKGPWFESSQLVLLRYGANSTQWAGMKKTTEDLLNSFQPNAFTESEIDAHHSYRQLIFQAIASLPKEIKRYLLSLQHDEGAVSEALGVIELVHRSVLRRTELKLVTVDPLAEDLRTTESVDTETKNIISTLEIGQWFLLKGTDDGALRVQLSLKIDDHKQLLFTNHAGLRERKENYIDFAAMLLSRTSIPLFYENSFSRSLLHVVEGSTEEDTWSPIEVISDEVEELPTEQVSKAIQDRQILQEEEEEEEQGQERKRVEQIQRQLQRERDEKFLREQAETQRKLREQAEANRLQREREAAEQFRQEEYLQRKRERERARNRSLFEDTPTPEATNEFKLPIGAWIRFHDGDSPLMAKLGTYDAEQDNYLFVDREGKKLREACGEEMRNLMGQSLVELLQIRSTFREDVYREHNKSRN
ncbi:MAG: hypothetical protein ACI8QT_001380 [Halioglobus sp.]